MKSRCSCSL